MKKNKYKKNFKSNAAPLVKLKNFFKKVIKRFGIKHQLLIAIEELSELQKEIIKNTRYKNNVDKLIEEIADVYIILEQLKIIYDVDSISLTNEITRKLKRLKERMNNE